MSLPDGVYAVGGSDGSRFLRTLEKFETRMQRWVRLARMQQARSSLSVVASADCQFIYAIGGFNGAALSSVERYSVSADKWESLSALQESRFMHSSVLMLG